MIPLHTMRRCPNGCLRFFVCIKKGRPFGDPLYCSHLKRLLYQRQRLRACGRVRSLNRRGRGPLVSADSFGFLFVATDEASPFRNLLEPSSCYYTFYAGQYEKQNQGHAVRWVPGGKREIVLHTQRGLSIKGQPLCIVEAPQQTHISLCRGMAQELGLSGRRRFSG